MRRRTRSGFSEVKSEPDESVLTSQTASPTIQAKTAPTGDPSSDLISSSNPRAAKISIGASSRTCTASSVPEAPSSSAGSSVHREIKREITSGGGDVPATASNAVPAIKRKRRTRAAAQAEAIEQARGATGSPVKDDVKPEIKRVPRAANKVTRKKVERNVQDRSVEAGGTKRRKVSKTEEPESRTKVSPRLAEKAALIIEVMDALYADPPIPLDHVDSFTLLCAVLLSAQTTDGQVNLVTKELFKVAPDPPSMSKLSQAEVQAMIRSVGLAPTKAKHLVGLSQLLLERFEGQVPRNFEDLQSLPGVGRKTAAVVMAQAFGVPSFPVDTHIHRLALRWGLTKHEKNASKVEQDLMNIFPKESWNKLHLQLIYFGREHCQARIHDATACPVCSWIKKTGAAAPKTLSDLTCLREFLASPTPPRKSSKNAIMYNERLLEMDQFKMKMET